MRISLNRVIAVGLLVCAASAVQAGTIAPGWDLFQTDPSSNLVGFADLKGVPLGTFNFGGSIEVQNTGNTDTIIQRLSSVSGVGVTAAPIQVQMVALQLESSTPTNFLGNGIDNYFITLQSVRGGPASIGQRTVTFDGTGNAGTYGDVIPLYIDYRKGALNGPIVGSETRSFVGSGFVWGRTPPVGAQTIVNVNRFLTGTNGDTSQDFWAPNGERGDEPEGLHLILVDAAAASVPLPASIWAGLILLAIIAAVTALRRRRA